MARLGWRRVAAYAGCFYLASLVPDYALRYTLNQFLPSMERIVPYREKPGLFAKVAYYREHAAEYDVIYVGDSRTYTGIAPALLDPQLGVRSVNLSSIGNWFPTQYPMLQQILPLIPEHTRVVWSIGHQNFLRMQPEVNLTYDVGIANIPRYMGWGYPWSSLATNIVAGVPGLKVFPYRHQIRAKVEGMLARRLGGGPAQAPESEFERVAFQRASFEPQRVETSAEREASLRERGEALARQYEADPDTLHVERLYDGGHITSLAVYQRMGNYMRVELRPEFFRVKQRELAADIRPLAKDAFEADAEYWKNFLAIVDLLASRNVKLIVNEFEEAPYHYEIPKNARLYREFMAEIAAFFRKRGVPYIRVDFSQLDDADYFDFNHLNSRGIERFSKLFVPELAPLLHASPHRDGVQ